MAPERLSSGLGRFDLVDPALVGALVERCRQLHGDVEIESVGAWRFAIVSAGVVVGVAHISTVSPGGPWSLN